MSHRVARSILVVAAAVVSVTAACSRKDGELPQAAPAAALAAPAAPAMDAAAAQNEAKKIFAERCTTCHGASGAGDGPASAGLVPKPRNFTSPEWQKAVTDDHLEQIIQYGGAAVGLSPAMPANPDLTSKPAVGAALVQYVRGLAK